MDEFTQPIDTSFSEYDSLDDFILGFLKQVDEFSYRFDLKNVHADPWRPKILMVTFKSS